MSANLVEKSFVNNNNDELFYLKWNNFQKNVSTQFEKLREDDDLVDITFACEGKKLTAHQLVLFACSPYFKELLKKNPSPHPVFFMNDVKYDVLKAILEYMYLGEVHITNENLKEFIRTAEGLQIRGLSKETNPEALVSSASTNSKENILDEFCRKRTDISETTQSAQNNKRLKTTGDQQNDQIQISPVESDVEPKVEMVEYLDADNDNQHSPTYCSMDNFTEKSNTRNNPIQLNSINAVAFSANQPCGSSVNDYKSEDESWMDKSLDNISMSSENSLKLKNKGNCSRSSSKIADDKANCLTPRCCPVCSRVYSNVSNLRQHMRLIHNPTAVCCPICGKHFNSELYLKRHYSSIHSINPSGAPENEIGETKPLQRHYTAMQSSATTEIDIGQQNKPMLQQSSQVQQAQTTQSIPTQTSTPSTNTTWNPYHQHDTTHMVSRI